MRLIDTIKISQKNLLRAKLRTFLTIAAVFIGSLTLSLTNGVGNGIKAYVNDQLGNLGAKDSIVIRAKQTGSNPISNDVVKYDPKRQTGGELNLSFITSEDLTKIQQIDGVKAVTPAYNLQLEYVATSNDEKYVIMAQQYIDGLNLQMIAGRVVDSSRDDEITLPARYIRPGTENDVLGKYVVVGYKNSVGQIVERNLKLVGVQQASLLGNSGGSISTKLAEEINLEQTAGIPNLSGKYIEAIAQYDKSYTPAQLTDLKKRIDSAGYNGQTIQDQIGTIGTVINGILAVLNVFAIITLLAAAFGIVNTLLMSVNERTSEIGLMKSLGATRKTIFSIFALEAASIGFWGALLGVLVSVGLGTYASKIAANTILKNFIGFHLLAFPVLPSVAVLVGIMLLAFAAGALPSLKASKLDPIKALRYE